MILTFDLVFFVQVVGLYICHQITHSNSTGEIVVTLNEHGVVHAANVWWGYSCGTNPGDSIKRRDFRILSLDNPCHCGIFAEGYCANLKSFWSKSELNQTMVRGQRTFSAQVDAPEDGRWVAFFIEVTYQKSPRTTVTGIIPPLPHDVQGRLMFTSEVSVWPQTFPYADCTGSACGNGMV